MIHVSSVDNLPLSIIGKHSSATLSSGWPVHENFTNKQFSVRQFMEPNPAAKIFKSYEMSKVCESSTDSLQFLGVSWKVSEDPMSKQLPLLCREAVEQGFIIILENGSKTMLPGMIGEDEPYSWLPTYRYISII